MNLRGVVAGDLADPTTRVIRLSDGRRLAYTEWGDPDGTPVIHNHGMPGSRLEHEAGPAVYRELRVRAITPDRPGYGFSDDSPRRTLADWPADVAELADLLGLRHFAMTALSGGGVYALACAAALPDRVNRVVLSGCPAPLTQPGALTDMGSTNRRVLWLAAHAPWLFYPTVRGMSGMVRAYPGFFVKYANRDKPRPDREWLESPGVLAAARASLREAMRSGGGGYARDLVLLSRPWGFRVEDITVPVELWQGDLDDVVPPTHGRRLAASLRRATLRACAGEAHMLMWGHLREILASASALRTVEAALPELVRASEDDPRTDR